MKLIAEIVLIKSVSKIAQETSIIIGQFSLQYVVT